MITHFFLIYFTQIRSLKKTFPTLFMRISLNISKVLVDNNLNLEITKIKNLLKVLFFIQLKTKKK